jgi:GPI inositol-deacylase
MNPRKLRVTVFSMVFIFILIFLFVPWQVAFLVSWIILYHTSVVSSQRLKPTKTSQSLSSSSSSSSTRPAISAAKDYTHANHNTSTHFLLLMTWLLPLVAPVLGVWVRTLATAGWTTPFDGDHNFLYVAPFLLFADWSWTCVRKLGRVKLLQRTCYTHIIASFLASNIPKWSILMIAFFAFFYGPRFNYLVFDIASASMWLIWVIHVWHLYWKSGSR